VKYHILRVVIKARHVRADVIRIQTQNDFSRFPSVTVVSLHCLLSFRVFFTLIKRI